ncbi:MAG: Ku protein [Candidatus Eremiobacteraeota bacterium]|nr:Ku protein [Candidatus Eremiobacteraeota bacterium]
MAHALWSGSVNFGLVSIPVKLFTAVRSGKNELTFHFLHKKDKGRINNVRMCSIDGKKVDWQDIVRGYEYEKGQYVILTDEDIKKASVEATQSVDIVQFVDSKEINPMLYDTPYYLEPDKKGRHAYALLREALKKSGKVGIAQVVIRTREHLAALRPLGEALVLETLHYADEIVPSEQFEIPPAKEKTPATEMKAAMMLIDTMSEKFDPASFHDTYKEKVLTMIEARAKGKVLPKAKTKAPTATNVVNIMDVLQRSLSERRGKRVNNKQSTKKAARLVAVS